jgi:hypothetical protein
MGGWQACKGTSERSSKQASKSTPEMKCDWEWGEEIGREKFDSKKQKKASK